MKNSEYLCYPGEMIKLVISVRRIGAFFFVIMNMIFGNLAVVELFVKDRPIFVWVDLY